MSDTPTLSSIVGSLQAKSIRERQEGITQLRAAFTNDRAVSAVDVKKGWIVLFEALFGVFRREKEACSDKGLLHAAPAGTGAALVRRLSEVASAIRWLVERAVHRFNKATMKLVLDHLYTNIRNRGKLIDPVALDYVKALKCIVSWAPHLDHLESKSWMKLVEFSFNVILEDSFKSSFVPPDDPVEPVIQEQSDEDEATGSEAVMSPRKRRHAEPARSVGSPAPSTLKTLPVTLEKIEFASLLSILLRAPSAPLVCDRYPYLPGAIFNRLERFLVQYPADTSLHHDYLTALSATLSQTALNAHQLTVNFAKATWPALVGMWGTKNQRLKEDLLVVIQMLFPYLTSALGEEKYDDGLSKLWRLLDGEAQSRWGVDSLSMDSLRFEISTDGDALARNAFTAKTFRYGWHFDSNQALAWAILELHADCGEQLYHLSESIHAIGGQSAKRRKLESPIDVLLASIRSHSHANVRTFHFQALLFFVDRHWAVLHAALQQQVIRTLALCLSDDDPTTQSWSFVCLAAIAHVEGAALPTQLNSDLRDNQWDTVWTLAMRRSNVPAVCRAACHAARVLLYHGKVLLSATKLLTEIENLAKDLDVQGPSAPYDSVCGFLVLCMRVASQDVGLYRMHLEDKVLYWLMDNWRPSGAVRKLPSYSAQDILSLLGFICSLGHQADIVYEIPLPDCAVVAAMKDNSISSVIRDYTLHAKLPPFRKHSKARTEQKMLVSDSIDNRELVAPQARERRVSAFLLKFLEEIGQDWESQKDVVTLPTTEKVRSTIDLSVIALYFESLLHVNGTQSNRRVIQAACKVMLQTLPLLSDQRWTLAERAVVLDGFGPLYLAEPHTEDEEPWEALLPPGKLTGIRTEVLRTLIPQGFSPQARAKASRRVLQRALFRSSDDLSTPILETFRSILKSVVEHIPRALPQPGRSEDTGDAFTELRLSREPSSSIRLTSSSSVLHSILETCIASLATFPILHSLSGEPTRDKQLVEWFVEINEESFFALLPSLMKQVRERTLNLSTSAFITILKRLGTLLGTYNYSWNDSVLILAARLLQSTMHIWLDPTAVDNNARSNAEAMGRWLVTVLVNLQTQQEPRIISWRGRDSIVSFLEEYLAQDPAEIAWMSQSTEDGPKEDLCPHVVLPQLGSDDDIRIRFRAATANARLFYHANALGLLPIELYSAIRESLTTTTSHFEGMLTRFLSLANLIIVSSAVRRGPYWHLLEASLYVTNFNRHIQVVLQGAAERMGMVDCSALFDIYASQIAYSVRSSRQDFTLFPPHLLGFRDRRECAERAFSPFTPMHLIAGGSDPASVLEGRRYFTNHCRTIHKTAAEGLLECLPELVGYRIVFWTYEHGDISTNDYPELDTILYPLLKELWETGTCDRHLGQQADGVVTAIVHTLKDQDFSQQGPIVKALEQRSQPAAQVFQELSALRNRDREEYDPILPAFDVDCVLRALDWFNCRVPHAEDLAITYHVLHRLLSALDEAPLVSEQLRLFNALCLWIAYHHNHFQDATLLHVVLNGATNLISQIDLARDAQSILHWAFTRLEHGPKDTRLTEILLRTACAAYDYSQSEAQDIARLGTAMLQWLEDEVGTLTQSRSLRFAVKKALLVWPRECPKKLQGFIGEPSLRDLQSILSDERISSNKFRMVRQIYHLAEAGHYEEETFAKRDFWKLKEYIPPANLLVGDELQAFISLLAHQRGQINGLDRDYANRQTACMRYLLQSRKEPQLEQSLLARKAVIATLFALLDDPSASQVHLAFKTLRALVSITRVDHAGSNGWPSEHHDELQLLRAYSRPFKARPSPDLADLLGQDSSIQLSEDYSRWITFFTTSLSDVLAANDSFYGPLSLILQTDQHFAEQVLPILVHVYLHADISRMDDSHTSAREVLSTYFSKLLGLSSSSEACRKALVETVLHLREWNPPATRDPLAHDKWLAVDFLVLSQNAVTCGAYTTALLFLELAAEYAEDFTTGTQTREEVLYQIYSRIDEPDGFYAISTQDVHGLLIKRLHHERQWDKAFQFHGAALETQSSGLEGTNGVLQALRAFGFDSLAMTTLQNMPGAETAVDKSMTYELGWRAGVWDLPQVSDTDDTAASLYLALRSIHRERDAQIIDGIVLEHLLRQMEHLKRLGHENLVEIRQVSQALMCLNEVQHWRRSDAQARLRSEPTTIDGNEYFLNIGNPVEFSDLEAILATRISLLRSAREQEERVQIGDMVSLRTQSLLACETSCLLQLSRAAREAGRSQVAINSVVRAQKLNGREHFDVACEFAKVLWQTKEPKMATEFLKGLLSSPSKTSSKNESTSQASLLALMGNWASQACLEKPVDIKKHYFDASIALIPDVTSPVQASVYHQYATFAERQYHAVAKSPDVLRLKVYIDRKTTEVKRRDDELANLRRNNQSNRQLESDKKRAQTMLNTDIALYTEHLKSRNIFLKQAIDMYSQCLASSDAFNDDAPIRLCSLWFSNFDNSQEDLPSKVGTALSRIPSHKFVFLAHQLSARLSDAEKADDRSTNQGNLRNVILRMCGEHPFHALFPVFCLQADSHSGKSTRHSLGSQGSQVVRAGAATSILSRLRSDPSCAPRIMAVELVCTVSLQWAKHPIKSMVSRTPHSKTFDMPSTVEIRKMSKVQVPVITRHTPLDPTSRYDNCVWIECYEPNFEVAGGVNLPKICKCIGSDGKKYKQLFKGEGNDDIRQDAVMEQVFDLVNVVLRNDRETTRRNLRIRGYKVIPLAAQAGVLEFVGNTMPLNSWLRRAHSRYRPADIKLHEFETNMAELRRSFGLPENVDPEQLTSRYVELRKRLQPVMRHWFTERTKDPSGWYRLRLYYSRSVATTSIVGHVIGLGDRHLSNILLDNDNGEVIHIDLGIAFEQGKLLPAPERVPFRLTPDMVDGMGTTGTQGVFQRCAEETLRVLQNRSDVILTVLEVFKHDPLHSWTASAMKLKGVQSTPRDREESKQTDGADEALNHIVGFNVSTATGVDEAADRALNAVTRKLDKNLSVEFTVNELVAEATDVVNLANMYIGWSPHC
ncbi:hypothetical protein BC835DRAFT_810570 [Cytidiella melzeri]|nr:hypothetical protein BC835DRAFT_810570 [Cytidiella melzeri]